VPISLKTYDISLKLPADERWAKVIQHERATARRLVKQFAPNLRIPGFLLALLRRGVIVAGGYYADEIDAWADALGTHRGLITAAQYAYELSMVGGYTGDIFACTAAIVDHPELGPVHLRYLDWDIQGIRKATRLFRFRQGNRSFTVIGMPGFVGALSGYVPGAYSVAINQAPASQRPRLNMSAATLVREVLADCDTYDEAVYSLSRTPLAAPVFFSVCGVEDGQGCVIERGATDYRIRRLRRGGTLVLTNHHEVKAFESRNRMDQELMDDSCDRYNQVQDLLEEPRKTLKGMLEQIAKFPTFSNFTVQRMAFNPRNDKALVLPA
jgi:hypothetical protein